MCWQLGAPVCCRLETGHSCWASGTEGRKDNDLLQEPCLRHSLSLPFSPGWPCLCSQPGARSHKEGPLSAGPRPGLCLSSRVLPFRPTRVSQELPGANLRGAMPGQPTAQLQGCAIPPAPGPQALSSHSVTAPTPAAQCTRARSPLIGLCPNWSLSRCSHKGWSAIPPRELFLSPTSCPRSGVGVWTGEGAGKGCAGHLEARAAACQPAAATSNVFSPGPHISHLKGPPPRPHHVWKGGADPFSFVLCDNKDP